MHHRVSHLTLVHLISLSPLTATKRIPLEEFFVFFNISLVGLKSVTSP